MDFELDNNLQLREVDRVEITTIIDNYTDVILGSTGIAKRPPLATGEGVTPPPLAEHGLSLLIKLFTDSEEHTILFDAGWSNIGVPHNFKVLGIDPNEIEGIVISHGHMDHFGALKDILRIKKGITVVLHPDALIPTRGLKFPDGRMVKFPTLDEQSLIEAGANLIKTKSPSLLASGLLASTGEVKRITDFEKGIPNAWLQRNGQIEHDSLLDDQGIVIQVKGKGLIVISGCAHSGIINMVQYARTITNVNKVYAILGGFHLSGPFFEPVIARTIEEFKRINPQILVPMHCTGWRAINEMANQMPQQFILNSVGTRFLL